MKKINKEDELRQEYSRLLPVSLKLQRFLETQLNGYLKSHVYKLREYEQIEVTSRVKECESAIKSLKAKKAEGGFDPSKKYSLTSLKDIVGVRVSVFPSSLLNEIKNLIEAKFAWTIDEKHSHLNVWKFQGKIKNRKIGCEVQIVPMLVSAFWKVEHATLYKPHPELKGIAENQKMKAIYNEVEEKLVEFESAFEEYINKQSDLS